MGSTISVTPTTQQSEDIESKFQTKNSCSTEKKMATTPNDFKRVKILGEGSFGKVYQVKYKENDKVYAMKVVSKIAKPSSKVTDNERIVLEKTKSPFLCEMFYYFESKEKKYFILEFLAGGDLFGVMSREYSLTEKQAQFYIAQVTLALEYLHENDIVYRDLKLENTMLDSQGHIKLTDFGLCKVLTKGSKTTTFCGTADYMAPERIRKQEYGHTVDHWSLGVLMYELIVGVPPFRNENRKTTKEKVTSGKVHYPRQVSQKSRQLIAALLTQSPTMRPSFEEIKCFSFFKNIIWERMSACEYPPPFKPNIRNNDDVSQFDSEFTKMKIQSSPFKAMKQNNQENDPFSGFDSVQ